MLKRAVITAYDVLSPLMAACLVVLVAAPPAHAYVDPSVMTYTIQAVAGVAVALSAVLGVALRRTRKLLFRVLKIDENANKIVEPDVEPVDAFSAGAAGKLSRADEKATQDKTRLKRGPEARRLSWPQRFLRALLGCGFLILTVFIAAPLEIVAAGSESLNFGFYNALPIVLGAGIVSILLCSLALSLVRGRAFDVLLTLVVALGIGCYVQSLLMNGPLPVADGSGLDLMKFKKVTLISTVVWVVIIAALIVLNAKKKSVCRPLLMAVCTVLIIMQSASLVSIGAEQKPLQQEGPERLMTTQGLYEVSENENVIVFVLDFFETRLLRDNLLSNDPTVLDEFTGFTFFENSTGSMIPTRYGVPFLLTGQLPQDGDTAEEYLKGRFDRSTFIKDVYDQGYTVDVYTDTLPSENYDEYIDNIITVDGLEMNTPSLLASLGKMSLYREAPWILKPLFWFSTDEVNRTAISDEMSPYVIDDAAYGDRLRKDGLSFSDAEKSFHFIHLMGAHFPFTMDAEGRLSSEETDKATQAHGTLSIVTDYFKQLKELGVYDEATIVVTSDHGDFILTEEPLDRSVSPILLVKPAETPEEAAQPLKFSDVPTGHIDFHATVIDAVGGDASKYGPTVFEIGEEERERIYWTTLSDGKQDVAWEEYVINGDVHDLENWERTGKRIDVPPRETS